MLKDLVVNLQHDNESKARSL